MDIFGTLFSNAWSVILVILFFGGSIFIHELGHFLAAKKRGLVIERFSIGFGPKILGWTKDGIDYRISLFPLGGYVALPQLADMGAIEGKPDKDAESLPPITYTDKVIVAVMGAVFNLIFAAILATILWFTGQPSSTEQLTNTVGYVAPSLNIDESQEAVGPAYEAGVKPGDILLAIDGEPVGGFKDIEQLVVTGSGRSESGEPQTQLLVERDGQELELTVNPVLMQFNRVSGERMRVLGISPKQDLVVGMVLENSPAQRAGIQKGDELVRANGEDLYSLKTLNDMINNQPNSAIDLVVMREGNAIPLTLKPESIAYTKPLSLVIANEGESIKVLTRFSKETDSNPVDPEAQGTLVLLESTIEEADLEAGAQILNFKSLAQLTKAVNEKRITQLQFNNGQVLDIPNQAQAKILEPRTQALIGVQLQPSKTIIHVNPIVQFEQNIDMTFRALGSLISPSSDLNVSHLMGPPGIIRTIYTFSNIDFRLLIWLIILININLAILNLMPIPVLDGGHIMFATIAKLRGKPINPHFIASLQGTFMLMLFGLMLYVSFFDVRRWQGDSQLQSKIELQQEMYIQTQFKR